MQLSFGFGPVDSRLAAVFAAGRYSAVYGPLIARTQRTGELSLSQLPPVSIHTYLEDREQFRNPRAAGFLAHRRAAQNNGRALRANDGAATVRERCARLLFQRPPRQAEEALSGSFEELLRLARDGKAAPPGVRLVRVHTPLGERMLSEYARDCLWRAFELPLFEELLGSEDEVLASECEAHSGFHLRAEAAIFENLYGELVITSLEALRYPVIRLRTGWVGAIEQSVCPCGERVARFVPVTLPVVSGRKRPRFATRVRLPVASAAAAV